MLLGEVADLAACREDASLLEDIDVLAAPAQTASDHRDYGPETLDPSPRFISAAKTTGLT